MDDAANSGHHSSLLLHIKHANTKKRAKLAILPLEELSQEWRDNNLQELGPSMQALLIHASYL